MRPATYAADTSAPCCGRAAQLVRMCAAGTRHVSTVAATTRQHNRRDKRRLILAARARRACDAWPYMMHSLHTTGPPGPRHELHNGLQPRETTAKDQTALTSHRSKMCSMCISARADGHKVVRSNARPAGVQAREIDARTRSACGQSTR